jgi:hypothetical protein
LYSGVTIKKASACEIRLSTSSAEAAGREGQLHRIDADDGELAECGKLRLQPSRDRIGKTPLAAAAIDEGDGQSVCHASAPSWKGLEPAV